MVLGKTSMTLKLALAGLLLSNAVALQGSAAVVAPAPSMFSKVKNYVTTGAKMTVGAALLASLLYYWTREGSDKQVVRYNLDELLSGENIGSNAWYLWLDGIIGHAGKKSSVKADPETGKIYASKEVAPKGIFGNISAYLKPVLGAVGTYLFIKAMCEAAADTTSKEPFATRLHTKIQNQLKVFGVPSESDYAKLGAPIVFGAVGGYVLRAN